MSCEKWWFAPVPLSTKLLRHSCSWECSPLGSSCSLEVLGSCLQSESYLQFKPHLTWKHTVVITREAEHPKVPTGVYISLLSHLFNAGNQLHAPTIASCMPAPFQNNTEFEHNIYKQSCLTRCDVSHQARHQQECLHICFVASVHCLFLQDHSLEVVGNLSPSHCWRRVQHGQIQLWSQRRVSIQRFSQEFTFQRCVTYLMEVHCSVY